MPTIRKYNSATDRNGVVALWQTVSRSQQQELTSFALAMTGCFGKPKHF
jgi:hypothetical protein